MAKDWLSSIMVFFHSRPEIEVVDKHYCHEFKYAAPLCKGKGAKA